MGEAALRSEMSGLRSLASKWRRIKEEAVSRASRAARARGNKATKVSRTSQIMDITLYCIVTLRLGRPRVGLACPAVSACSVTVIRVHLQSSRGCTGLGLSV